MLPTKYAYHNVNTHTYTRTHTHAHTYVCILKRNIKYYSKVDYKKNYSIITLMLVTPYEATSMINHTNFCFMNAIITVFPWVIFNEHVTELILKDQQPPRFHCLYTNFFIRLTN